MLQIEITIDKIKNIYLLISTLRQQSGRAKRYTHSMRISFASAPAKGPKTGADVNFSVNDLDLWLAKIEFSTGLLP